MTTNQALKISYVVFVLAGIDRGFFSFEAAVTYAEQNNINIVPTYIHRY